ncbi:MAG: PocR ligand-binding domain-containing protein [Desulfovibrionaceae bacterium]|nr:PocR ligand-binding domain-containing protein [Desulfovibrionaceae bacterium]
MLMTDLLPKEKWLELEHALHNDWGVNACAYNADGMTFTGFKNFVNPLCAEIKSHPEGIQAICSVAHQHMAQLAKSSGKTVIEQCDAGLLKICTPVFRNGEFVGIVGGCGRVPEGSEVDTFNVHKAINIPLETVESLAGEVPTITMERAREMGAFLEEFVAAIH